MDERSGAQSDRRRAAARAGASAEKLALTSRSLDRTLKVARTIADRAGTEEIGEEHLAEALQYRGRERVKPACE